MQLSPNDKFWIVTDPELSSASGDILFETTLLDLELQFKGGLSWSTAHPMLFTDRGEAEAEARRRLTALSAFRAIARASPKGPLDSASRVALLDSRGEAIFESELP